MPIAIAVLFSFNKGRSQATYQGVSWHWYFWDKTNSVLHNPQLHAAVIQTVRLSVLTTLIAVPLGVAFALGINRWRGPVSSTFNFVMILSFAMRRVMLPLLAPAIFASAVLVFSGVIDDFVIVDLLSSNAGNTPMSVIIYSTQHGGNGGPALNALGTIMLVMSFVIAIIGYLGYRFLTRGERGSRIEALTTIAGSEG